MTTSNARQEETILDELAFLEALLERRPAIAPILLNRMGELGEESKADLPRLLSEHAVELARFRSLKQRQRREAATRVAAVAALIAGSPAMGGALPAVAAETTTASASQQAALTPFELRVMDRASGQPLEGVRLQTAGEELVAVTDAEGKAMIPARFAAEPVLTLERDGYPMVLLEGAKLTARGMITMKHFSPGMQLAQSDPGEAMAATQNPAPASLAMAPTLTPPVHVGMPTAADAQAVVPHHADAAVKPPAIKAPVEPKAPVQTAKAPVQAAKAPVQVASAIETPKAPVVHQAPVEHHANPRAFGAEPPAITGQVPAPPTLPAPTKIAEAKLAPVASALASGSDHAVVKLRLPARSKMADKNVRRASVDQIAAVAENAFPAHPHAPQTPAKAPAMPAPEAALPKDKTGFAHITLPKTPRPSKPHHPLGHAVAAYHGGRTGMYRVRSGDMLCSIAQRELGASSRWTEIFNANRDKLSSTRYLRVGMVLAIPRGASASYASHGHGGTYVVRPGDTLSKIAHNELGKAAKWRDIYAANRHTVRNPWLIFPGQHLILPGSPRLSELPQDPAPKLSWATMRATDGLPEQPMAAAEEQPGG